MADARKIHTTLELTEDELTALAIAMKYATAVHNVEMIGREVYTAQMHPRCLVGQLTELRARVDRAQYEQGNMHNTRAGHCADYSRSRSPIKS